MTELLDATIDTDPFAFSRGLRGYLAGVAGALGVGLESCAIDPGAPASAYIALDQRVEQYPDRDLALLWDERYGWSAAVETHSGEDLIVLTYFGGDPLPPPATVVRLVAAIRDGKQVGRLTPPDMTGHDVASRLRGYELVA
jgi:Family of unknown function (DUF6292)